MYFSRHEPVLGTVLELRIDASSEEASEVAEAAVLAEFDRLERVFSVYDEASELRRWQRGELAGADAGPSAELTGLLRDSLQWQRRGQGAYNPAIGRLVERWRRAEADGVVPSPDELQAMADAIQVAPYEMDGDRVIVTGDIGALSFNAIAKGRIVDLAAAVGAASPGVRGLMVSAGGDLVQRGGDAIVVGIEDPSTPYDNAPPLTKVQIDGLGIARSALATSGAVRRGFTVGGVRYGHVIDPRNGQPVDHARSVSVIAPDATKADVLATICGVLEPARALGTAQDEDVACLLVKADGEVWKNKAWTRAEHWGQVSN